MAFPSLSSSDPLVGVAVSPALVGVVPLVGVTVALALVGVAPIVGVAAVVLYGFPMNEVKPELSMSIRMIPSREFSLLLSSEQEGQS